jgi:hypothetical protein
MIDGVLVKETDDGFVWQGTLFRETFTFKIVTLERFNSYWRKKVHGVPQFQHDEDLHEWYRRYSSLNPD